MKRFFGALCPLLCICLLFAGCGGKDLLFTYYIDSSPDILDPQVASAPQEQSVVTALFDGLFSMDASGRAVPCAAESYEISSSGLVYTIHLKKDLTWRFQGSSKDDQWQEEPVRAADFVFGLQRVFLPETRSPHASTLSAIKNADAVLNGAPPSSLGVRAVDDYTIEITLDHGSDTFLEALTCAGAMPCHQGFFESTGGSYGLSGAALLCNGRYDLRTWNDTDGVTLTAVDKKNDISRIRLPVDDGSSLVIARLQNDEADAGLLSPTENANGFLTEPFSTTTWVLLFNPQTTGLSEQSVRQALAAVALNSAAVYTPGGLEAASGLVPPSVSLNGTPFRSEAGDAALHLSAENAALLFRSGLSSAGLDKLSGVRVIGPDREPYRTALEGVNQQWQKDLSAFFSLEAMEESKVLSRVRSGDFDIAFLPVSAFSNDLYTYFSIFSKGDLACAGPSDSSFAENLSSAAPGALITSAKQAENTLIQYAAVAPLYFENTLFARDKWLKGLYFSPFGPVLDFHSFEV